MYDSTRAPETGMEELLEGSLLLDDSCLVVHTDAGREVVPVFPDEVVWDPADHSLTTAEEWILLGDRLVLAGAYADTTDTHWRVPTACQSRELFPVSSIEEVILPDIEEFPTHPDFAAHFTGGLYEDYDEEFAPFGSDEGFDMLAIWAERQDELSGGSTVRDVYEDFLEDPGAFDAFLAEPGRGDGVDEATITVGAGFTLLRLTGAIDSEGERAVLTALDRLERYYGDTPQFRTMRKDLTSYQG